MNIGGGLPLRVASRDVDLGGREFKPHTRHLSHPQHTMKKKLAKLVRRLTGWAWMPQIAEAYRFYDALSKIASGAKLPVQIARRALNQFDRRG